VSSLVLAAPAKLNLFLAVTGRRADGFHDLVSLVTPVAWGDTLHVEAAAEFSLTCDDPAVPIDETNLVLKAAKHFRAATNWNGAAKFFLQKRIPMGAGLGGGSSDAVAALRALNQLAGDLLVPAALEKLAAEIGSDCPLFLRDAPVVMRGRGERIEPLPAPTRARLTGRRVLIFKPPFGVPTPWAYARLAAGAPQSYFAADAAEARLAQWCNQADAKLEELCFNSFEAPAFGKYLALPTLLAELRERFGLVARMSGSGSACFLFLAEAAPVAEILETIRTAWGNTALVVETRLT
jgi:4-diphosphocytidyl-2-C-methyl-D-erythritol kinase